MQSKVAQLVDLFLANDGYDGPPRESQSNENATTNTITPSSASCTHSPASESIHRTEDSSYLNAAADHEVHLRIHPFLDPTDWFLRIDENTPCLSYVVSKLWSWEQIKHCICYELRLHASCTPRQIGQVTDYYYRPQSNINNKMEVVQQPRPICNRADFLSAIHRPPECALYSNTTYTCNRSYHVLDILATCKPLIAAPPTSPSRDCTDSHSSSDTAVDSAVVANATLADIGMAEALMGLRQASAAATTAEETSGPTDTVDAWHDGAQVGVDVQANVDPRDPCTSYSSHGIDIWNSGPQDDNAALILNKNNDNDCSSQQIAETRAMPPPAMPTPVHSCNAVIDEKSHHVQHKEAQDNDDDDDDDDGQYDDGVDYPYSDASDDDSQLEPPMVDKRSKKRPRIHSISDSKTHSIPKTLPSGKKPGKPKSPSSHQNQQEGVCVETTTMTTTSGIILPVLNPYDVMCSRSKVAFKAIGNRRLRVIMELHAPRYAATCRKVDKTAIVSSIVEIVNGAGGNFIRRNRTSGIWEIAPHEIAKEKVGHGLRDAVGNMGRSIYDVLGHDYFSKIRQTKDGGHILLRQIAQKAPDVCKPPSPEPHVPECKSSALSPIVEKPSYESKSIPIRFGSPCKKSHGYPRTSYGPFKKRLLLKSSPFSGVKTLAKKAIANKKTGMGSPATPNNKSPTFGGVKASAGKTVSNDAAGIVITPTPNNKSPKCGAVKASAVKTVAKDTSGIGSPAIPINKSPAFGAGKAPARKTVAWNMPGIATLGTPNEKSPPFSAGNASVGKPVAKNIIDMTTPGPPNIESSRFVALKAPADKIVATNTPGMGILGTPIGKSPQLVAFKASAGNIAAKNTSGMGTQGTPISKSPKLVVLKAPAGTAAALSLAGIGALRIPNYKGRPRSKCSDIEAASVPFAKRQRPMVATRKIKTTTMATRACPEAPVAPTMAVGDAPVDPTFDLLNFKGPNVAACKSTSTTGTSDSGYVPSSAV
jgi:hypothetical protein